MNWPQFEVSLLTLVSMHYKNFILSHEKALLVVEDLLLENIAVAWTEYYSIALPFILQ